VAVAGGRGEPGEDRQQGRAADVVQLPGDEHADTDEAERETRPQLPPGGEAEEQGPDHRPPQGRRGIQQGTVTGAQVDRRPGEQQEGRGGVGERHQRHRAPATGQRRRLPAHGQQCTQENGRHRHPHPRQRRGAEFRPGDAHEQEGAAPEAGQ